jgi:hypothetical protein
MESLDAAVDYLETSQALQLLESDPYWPKWDGPWWHMLLLHEMHMSKRIPTVAIEALIRSINSNCLSFFPLTEEEIPAGQDPISGIPCHCQLGSVYQVLTAHGIEVDERLPWIRPWFLKYQMEDGGLNCDEAAYSKSNPKSSIVSTLPALEAILFCTRRELSFAEIAFLDRGAEYLIRKQLFRAESDGRILDESWLKLCFPRFYHYDILRGLVFLLRWAVRLNRSLPSAAIKEAVQTIETAFDDDRIYIRRSVWKDALTRTRDPQTNEWSKVTAKAFPLLETVGKLGEVSPYLTASWCAAKKDLATLLDRSLVRT